MGKTRYLFKKIRDTKGTFHVKMGIIKDINGIDLTEAEDIKKNVSSVAGPTAPLASWHSSSPSWPSWSLASSRPWASQAGVSGKRPGCLGLTQG